MKLFDSVLTVFFIIAFLALLLSHTSLMLGGIAIALLAGYAGVLFNRHQRKKALAAQEKAREKAAQDFENPFVNKLAENSFNAANRIVLRLSTTGLAINDDMQSIAILERLSAQLIIYNKKEIASCEIVHITARSEIANITSLMTLTFYNKRKPVRKLFFQDKMEAEKFDRLIHEVIQTQ